MPQADFGAVVPTSASASPKARKSPRGTKTIQHVLTAYIAYYNEARPHQGLDQQTPMPPAAAVGHGPIQRHDRLGGLLRVYYQNVA